MPNKTGWRRCLELSRFEAFCEALTEHRFKFAKTMPYQPHWYTKRAWFQSDQRFDDVVTTLRSIGYDENYGNRIYTRVDVNGMCYWTMGDPLETTILINRAYVQRMNFYDEHAHQYDAFHESEDSILENEELFETFLTPHLDDLTAGAVLDIGCGTGLLAEMVPLSDGYVGIDPSALMLAQFKRKAPQHAPKLLHTTLEGYNPQGKRFDLVVATFGSASYVDPTFYPRITDLIAPGGRALLMFYRDGYSPVTYEKAGQTAHHVKGGAEKFMAAVKDTDTCKATKTDWNSFEIVEIER